MSALLYGVLVGILIGSGGMWTYLSWKKQRQLLDDFLEHSQKLKDILEHPENYQP